MKKKLLVVASSYPKFINDINGGFVHELSKRLTDEFDVFVVSPWEKGLLKNEIIDNVVIYRHYQFFWNIKLAYGIGIFEKLKNNPLNYLYLPIYFLFQFLAIKKICNKEKIQIIHSHWLIPNALISVLYKKALNPKIQLLNTIHGSDYWGGGFIHEILRKFVLKNSNIVTVVSDAIKNDIIAKYEVKEVYVRSMGIDTELFNPNKYSQKLKEIYNINGPFLLYVGILVEAKGILELIKSLPIVLNKYPECKLVIVGEGELKKDIIQITKELCIDHAVILVGKIKHQTLCTYYASANVFILPSKSEGFGLVYAEALSSGLLTISSDLSSVHDIIKDYETGFFLNDTNAESIANKLIEVINNQEKYENVKLAGRRHIINNFDWSLVSKQFKSFFNSQLK